MRHFAAVVVLAVLVLRVDKEEWVQGMSCVVGEGHWDEKNVGSNQVGPLPVPRRRDDVPELVLST